MIKTLRKIGIERNLFNFIKGVYTKPTANIILKDERLNAFPRRLGKRQGCPLSPLLFHVWMEVLVSAITSKKEAKGSQVGKE